MAKKKAIEKTDNVELLVKLATDWDKAVRAAVAMNPNAPVETLVKLATDTEGYVRRALASNPTAPAETLAQLATDEDRYVRWAVAANPTAPAETLAELATDTEGYEVREAVADNPKAPAEALVQLATDDDSDVRQTILKLAKSKSTPVETLIALYQQKGNPAVSKAARNNPSFPEDLEGWAINLEDWVSK